MSKTPIQLSDHFTCRKLICFTLPSITMIIFTAIYGVVDGFFVSNYAGKTPFAAVNLIIPLLLILGSVGFMFGTGGGALIAKTMGQGDRQRANNIFSMIVYASAACGVVLAALGFVILRPAAVLMGAEGELLEQALIYGRINLIALPFYVLQYEFQCLFATAEKPRLGLSVTVAAGVTNMVLDALFVAVLSGARPVRRRPRPSASALAAWCRWSPSPAPTAACCGWESAAWTCVPWEKPAPTAPRSL